MRYVLAILLLSSCAAKITQSTNTVEKDSLAVRVVHHHDTVRIKGDSIKVIVKETVRDTIIKERQGRAELDIIRRLGQTTTKCKCDSIQKALTFALTDTTKYKTKITTITRTIYQPYPKSTWAKFCEWFTWIIIAMIIGGTLYKFRKSIPYLNLIP